MKIQGDDFTTTTHSIDSLSWTLKYIAHQLSALKLSASIHQSLNFSASDIYKVIL